MLRIIFFFCLTVLSSAKVISAENSVDDIKKATGMIAFAKKSLTEGTQLAKDEFGIEDEVAEEIHVDPNYKPEKNNIKYSSKEYRDIFYAAEDSTLINKAFYYFKHGKKMPELSEAHEGVFTTIKRVRKPLLKLSSVIYDNNSTWSVFTNVGKFTYKNPRLNSINIVGISEVEVEFVVPITEKMRPAIRTLGKNVAEHKARVSVQNRNLVMRLRTGECVFEDELKIVNRCATSVEEIEKQVEI